MLLSLASFLTTTTIIALLALPPPAHTVCILCAANLYGRPLLADALQLSRNLPFVRADPDHKLGAVRTFAEPAFFTPRFQSLRNTGSEPMVQLPRVWRFRSARIALLFPANSAGGVSTPVITANWRAVQVATAVVQQYCTHDQQAGGVWIISDESQTPYLSLYLYASGSPFEEVLNRYMISGLGVNPFNPRGLGVEGVVFNSSVLGRDVVVTAGGPAPSVVQVLGVQ